MFYKHIFFLILINFMLNNFSSGLTSTQDSDYTSKPCIATSTAILQGLDKITGRVVTVETTVDLDVFFGTLSIRVLKCLKTRPNDISDSAAYLVIQEHKPTSINAILFKGWMLATHPSFIIIGTSCVRYLGKVMR